MHTLIGQQNKMYQPMAEPIDEELTTEKESTFTHTRKERTKVVLGLIRHHEPVNIPFCGIFYPDQDEQCQICDDSECKDCTVYFDNLDNAQRLLLYQHSKLDHVGFNQIKDPAKMVYSPEILTS